MPENTKEMHIRIDVYKPTGKWYTGHDVWHEDIPLESSAFKQFVKNNLPAQYGGGYIVVTDCDNGAGFHNCLLKFDELMGII